MFEVEILKGIPSDGPLLGLPVITHKDLGVLEPAASYFLELHTWGGQRHGSIRGRAYIIRIWCNFLLQKGCTWSTAREKHMREFVEETRSSGFSENRLATRIRVLTDWYYFLAQQNIGGLAVRTFCAALTSDRPEDFIIHPEPRFKAKRGPKNVNGDRPTPSDENLRKVLDALASHDDEYISDRNFLIGFVAANTGLRAMGLRSLSISFLDSILADNRLIQRAESCVWYVSHKENRDRLRAALIDLRETVSAPLFGEITEKRSVSRQVSFHPDTMLLLLNHIWGTRHRKLAQRFGGRSPNDLWVSTRTGRGLAFGVINNILKFEGFEKAGVAGSGHRLRAAFLTNTAVSLLRRARRSFGGNYDGASILTQLAMLAGHASPQSLQPYLDDAALILALMEEHPQ